jgi:NADH-quinone oxidoreductase subunit J
MAGSMSPWLQHTVFGAIAALAVISSLLVVTRRNPIYSALFLVIVFAGMSAIFLLLGADFLGFMQLLVYAGAIMVLYLFVIMLINPREGDLPEEGGISERVFAGGVSALVFCLLWFAIHESPMLTDTPVVFPSLPSLGESHGGTAAFGIELFREHLLVFELTSVLILVGIVGAVHLSIRTRTPAGRTAVPHAEGSAAKPAAAGHAEEPHV